MGIILVVEDDGGIADFLQEFLTEIGYDVTLVGNGRQALDSLMLARPSVILSDIMMPVMSGLELYHQIAQDHHYRTIPLILMSAAAHPPPHEDACPYTAFLRKPFQLLDVEVVLQHAMETHLGESL